MNTKTPSTKNKATPAKYNTNAIEIVKDESKSEKRKVAEFGISATNLNALTAHTFTQFIGETDLSETIKVMREKTGKVNSGDLSELETTLAAQVVSLDAMFNQLARRASLNMGEHINAAETYMRLALKAQSQCARTIEVLAAMKNPPVVFAKQANISHGNQQVNNGSNQTAPHAPAHTGETINQPNELLVKGNHGSEKMDGRTTQATIPKDKAMATVAT